MTSKMRSLFTLILSLLLMIWLFPKATQPEGFRQILLNWGTTGLILDLLVLSLEMLFPIIPFPLLAGINALAFGWPLGFLLTLLGSMLGSSLGFWLARSLAPRSIRVRLAGWVMSHGSIVQVGFVPVFLARLIPFIPAAAVNYLAGMSSIRFAIFFWATLLGKIPIIVWETSLGQSVWQISSHPWRFILVSAIGLPLLPLYYYFKKTINKKDPGSNT